jgi:hypothetical protein
MAEWQQELRVDVSPDLLMQQDALLLLEVLQMPASFKRYRVCAAPDMIQGMCSTRHDTGYVQHQT